MQQIILAPKSQILMVFTFSRPAAAIVGVRDAVGLVQVAGVCAWKGCASVGLRRKVCATAPARRPLRTSHRPDGALRFLVGLGFIDSAVARSALSLGTLRHHPRTQPPAAPRCATPGRRYTPPQLGRDSRQKLTADGKGTSDSCGTRAVARFVGSKLCQGLLLPLTYFLLARRCCDAATWCTLRRQPDRGPAREGVARAGGAGQEGTENPIRNGRFRSCHIYCDTGLKKPCFGPKPPVIALKK